MAEPFIWHDPVEAQQAMSYAANAAKADAMKQENLFRMAELGLRRQQQQETAELNRLITASQLQQRDIENQFRDRQLTQQAELERERNKNILEGYRIQFPDGRIDSRTAVEESRQAFELEQQKKDEERDNALSQQWQILERDINALQADLDKPLPSTGFLGLARGDYNTRIKENETKRSEIGRLKQRQQMIEGILAERGKVPSGRQASLNIPGVNDIGVVRNVLPAIPSASSMNIRPTPMENANLTPFQRQLWGLQPGQVIEQGGQRFTVSGEPAAPIAAAQLATPRQPNPAEVQAVIDEASALGLITTQDLNELLRTGGVRPRSRDVIIATVRSRLQQALSQIRGRRAPSQDELARRQVLENLLTRLDRAI